MSFKRLNTKIYQKSGPVITPDYIYWKQLGVPVLVKEFGPIDYIDFSPLEPYHFAVTCSVRVQVYNPITKLVVKNLSRFRENAYGATFRSDGRLLCAGGEETNVKLFDLSTKSLLRLFKGHSAAVHRTFFIDERPQIASFSDDKTVKIWDIPTEKNILTYSDHTDYIRAGATSPVAPDIILSGSYDNTVKMFDTRTDQVVSTMDHGCPVESLLFLPSGGICLSAGGTVIKIWDTIAGGKLLGSISQHHKTITCLRLASDNKRLLSGSLDRHVKIYDVATFKVVHTLNYPSSVLSLGVSKNDDTVVAGLTDGLVAINRRVVEENSKEKTEKKASFKYRTNKATVDVVVKEVTHETEAKFDKCLRKFEYSKALDIALRPITVNKTPEITVSIMQELMRRKGLGKAFEGRDSKSLNQILRFFIRYVDHVRYCRVLIGAVHIFLETYEEKIALLSSDVQHSFWKLHKIVNDELELGKDLAQLQGTIDMILSAASIHEDREEQKPHHLTPSVDAQKNLVVNLT